MKAPNEIFVTEDLIESNALDEELDYIDGRSVPYTKYIRADLAELTWDTVQDIITIYDRLCSEYYSRLYKHRPDTKIFYKEVLRRFLESKRR